MAVYLTKPASDHAKPACKLLSVYMPSMMHIIMVCEMHSARQNNSGLTVNTAHHKHLSSSLTCLQQGNVFGKSDSQAFRIGCLAISRIASEQINTFKKLLVIRFAAILWPTSSGQRRDGSGPILHAQAALGQVAGALGGRGLAFEEEAHRAHRLARSTSEWPVARFGDLRFACWQRLANVYELVQ